MKRVYIAGPYSSDTADGILENVTTATRAGVFVVQIGAAPFVPHLSHYLHAEEPQPYETWMAVDFAWLRASDVVWRLPGESAGAEREVALAKELGIPVVTTAPELAAWLWGEGEA